MILLIVVAATVSFGLVGLTMFALAVRWAFDAPDFEDWVLVALMTFGGLIAWTVAAAPWIAGFVR